MILTCRHIVHWNRLESPENTHTYSQLIQDKGARNTQWGKTASSINGVGNHWIDRCKIMKCDFHLIPQTQNHSKQIKD